MFVFWAGSCCFSAPTNERRSCGGVSIVSHNKPTINGREVEIERKYIVVPPSDAELDIIRSLDGFSESFIEQIYITDINGGNARIRRRRFDDVCKYYYTVKQNINGISKFESEREISESEYNALRGSIKENTRPIKKIRRCFLFDGQLFELDVYELDENLATLEIELQSEDQQVRLPPFVSVVKDATFDGSYSNFSLAHRLGSVIDAENK